jgi:hypothetical protein
MWTKLATRDLGSSSWWAQLFVCHETRGPIVHALNWNQKGGCRPSKLKALRATALCWSPHTSSTRFSPKSHLEHSWPRRIKHQTFQRNAVAPQALVWYKSAEFLGEYDHLLDERHVAQHWSTVSGFIKNNKVEDTEISESAVLLILQGACDYWFRVHKEVLSYPSKLAWLVFSPPPVNCERRKCVCLELLQQDP